MSPVIPFKKMHGIGNDFIVLWGEDFVRASSLSKIKKWAPLGCDRRFGIGADQILVLNSACSKPQSYDFEMIVINADGSIAEMCGNGLRAAVLEFCSRTKSKKKSLSVKTGRGILTAERLKGNQVRTEMGCPEILGVREVLGYPGIQVSMGNPHFVILSPLKGDIEKIGPRLETASCFPNRTNVEWVRKLSQNSIQVDVWERGAGRTLACGTGACASAVAAIDQGIVRAGEVKVTLPGGICSVHWSGHPLDSVTLSGPAEWIFSGEIRI